MWRRGLIFIHQLKQLRSYANAIVLSASGFEKPHHCNLRHYIHKAELDHTKQKQQQQL